MTAATTASANPTAAAPTAPLRVLLSNDDGYNAPGLEALHAVLVARFGKALHLDVVAPEQDRSGASNSLTLDRPLTVRQASNGFYYVNGTPTDCVHIAVTGFLPQRPHLVLSGINNGANMGDDTIYSGTVAAAMEGYQCGLPAMAFSLVGKGYAHLDAAAQVVGDVLQRYLQPLQLGHEYAQTQAHAAPHLAAHLGQPMLLNVNIPALPYGQLQGLACTRLGKRHNAEAVVPATNPKGETVYWIGPPGAAKDAGPGTDFYAIGQGMVSITPLKADLTHVEHMHWLSSWAVV